MSTLFNDGDKMGEKLFGNQVAKMFNCDRNDRKLFCDVIIQAREKRYDAHRAMLGLRSKFFEKLFTTEMKEKYAAVVNIDMDDDRFERILDYCYTGDADISTSNVTDIIEAADYTELLDLKSECEAFMLEFVDVDNCLMFRSYALSYNLTQVVNKSNRVVEDNFAEIVQHDDFKRLKIEEVESIMEIEKAKLLGEAAYVGVIEWVNHDPTNRRESFVKLFSQIDLSTFSSEFLRSTVVTEALVRENAQCSSAVLDSIVLQNVPLRQRDLTEALFFFTIGGENSQKQFVKYDIKDGEQEILPQLAVSRYQASSVKCGSTILTFGGYGDNRRPQKCCEIFDLTCKTRWKKAADMPEARRLAAVASSSNGTIYLSGGRDIGDEVLSTTVVYNAKQNTWTKGPEMLYKRSSHAMVPFKNAIYILGGSGGRQPLETCERFEDGRSSEISFMNERRSGLAAVVFDKYIYAIGGYNASAGRLASVERYDPARDKWSKLRSMAVARSYHGAFVSRGKIYVVGGIGEKSVEIYDPKNDIWTTSFDTEDATSNHCNVVAM